MLQSAAFSLRAVKDDYCDDTVLLGCVCVCVCICVPNNSSVLEVRTNVELIIMNSQQKGAPTYWE